jgi:excisionase family DNA binding protein
MKMNPSKTHRARRDQPFEDDRLMRKPEVAEMMACSTRHVERQANTGRLPRVKIGRCVRFKLSDVLRLMQGGIA